MPDAGDAAFWEALGIPPEMRQGIVESAGVVEIWPENLQPFEVFRAMLSQWRHGFNGPTGLDYAALPIVEQRLGVKKRDRADIFAAVQVMESEALAEWSKRRK